MFSLLIVDDDERMRGLIKSIVADLADTITECADGSEATERYAEHHPDWVLMDLMMPHINGITATRQIKAFDPNARIVIVTGHESQSLRKAVEVAGACAFVLKDNLIALREILAPSYSA